MTRAFYSRADLDLILSSPASARRLFAVRIGAMALSITAMALLLAAPFINVLAFQGGWHWLGAYGAIVGHGGMAATALAVALTVALFRAIGPKRTRLVAQIVAAVIGAAFVIGLQVAAILSTGTLSRLDVPAVGDAAGDGAGDRQPALVAGAGDDRRAAAAAGACSASALVAARRGDRGLRAAFCRTCHGRRRPRHGSTKQTAPHTARSAGASPMRRCGARNGRCCGAIPG